jgi:hypothetical protein
MREDLIDELHGTTEEKQRSEETVKKGFKHIIPSMEEIEFNDLW